VEEELVPEVQSLHRLRTKTGSLSLEQRLGLLGGPPAFRAPCVPHVRTCEDLRVKDVVSKNQSPCSSSSSLQPLLSGPGLPHGAEVSGADRGAEGMSDDTVSCVCVCVCVCSLVPCEAPSPPVKITDVQPPSLPLPPQLQGPSVLRAVQAGVHQREAGVSEDWRRSKEPETKTTDEHVRIHGARRRPRAAPRHGAIRQEPACLI